jgi:hypothetical protein
MLCEGTARDVGVIMSELDVNWCLELFTELLLEQGEEVFRLYWDSRGPGAGADCELILRFENLYFPRSSVEGLSGPFATLDEALQSGGFLGVTAATVSIDCSELSAGDIIRRLQFVDAEAGHIVRINGEAKHVTQDSRVE